MPSPKIGFSSDKKKVIKKLKLVPARNKRSPKGEPMSNPLSYPESIGYNF